ncbi:cytidine deaminase [Aeoliella sp. ICT_H6.2]|uniref:Cytidine deaminase n=1 Tax=Aeoliella straminimaris TaxID=2954799 RepID=A0A9X2JK28_9BACT|nr:cytidine deaminase [Aeoliella straminimaris]MCO6047533.1 cytidine deaminase [Aeoliella straminimaris]
MEIDTAKLLHTAKTASGEAYAPYSKFSVGAAVLADDGRVFTGVNVENASYGLTICAERAAVCAAVTAGARRLVAVAIFTPTPEPASPCGACRQVLAEFAHEMRVYIGCQSDQVAEYTLEELLPHQFKF